MPQPEVAVVILNTNRRDDTLACLASLQISSYTKQRVIVLDNASGDGSVPAIRAGFPHVQIVELTENRGYAGNNNVGIETAVAGGADWVLVLNEDTVLDSECLARLVAAGESRPAIGIVGPMVYHHEEPSIIQSAGGKIDRYWHAWHSGQNEVDQGQYPHPRPVDWVHGCAIMLRRQVIEEIGMLDERFFYYWEETEWCLRARGAGWEILHVPQARLWHKGVQRNYQPKPSVTYYSTRNHLLLLSKHGAPLHAWLVTWGQIVRTLISWTVKPKWRHMRDHRNAMVLGARDYLRQRWGPAPS